MKITDQWLRDNMSPRGGWTKAQFAAIGVPWPPPKGWKLAVIGQEITPEQQRAVENADHASNKGPNLRILAKNTHRACKTITRRTICLRSHNRIRL